jgi:hypothetical protein
MPYNLALFAHILGALGYFIALGVGYASVLGVRRAQNVQALRLWAGAAGGTLRGLFPLAGLTILVAGIYMVTFLSRDSVAWAGVALVAFLLIGPAYPLLVVRRVGTLAGQARDLPADAPLPAALAARARDPLLWLAANAITGVTVGIVYLMTVKPDAVTSLIALGVALAVGLVVGLVFQGRPVRVMAAERA